MRRGFRRSRAFSQNALQLRIAIPLGLGWFGHVQSAARLCHIPVPYDLCATTRQESPAEMSPPHSLSQRLSNRLAWAQLPSHIDIELRSVAPFEEPHQLRATVPRHLCAMAQGLCGHETACAPETRFGQVPAGVSAE